MRIGRLSAAWFLIGLACHAPAVGVAATAALSFSSEPQGVTIYLGERKVGVTPCHEMVAPGKYVVNAVPPTTGHNAQRGEVTVPDGQVVEVKFKFEVKEWQASSIAVEVLLPQSSGALLLVTDLPSDVKIDGRDAKRKTPFRVNELTVGWHTVGLTRAETPHSGNFERRVRIFPDDTTVLRAFFDPANEQQVLDQAKEDVRAAIRKALAEGNSKLAEERIDHAFSEGHSETFIAPLREMLAKAKREQQERRELDKKRIEKLLQNATAALDKGDIIEAHRVARRVLREDPDDAEAKALINRLPAPALPRYFPEGFTPDSNCLWSADGWPKEIVAKSDQRLRLVLIEPGEFEMGAPVTESGTTTAERPRHSVKIGKAFYLGRTEVDNGQFARFAEAAQYKTVPELGRAYNVLSFSGTDISYFTKDESRHFTVGPSGDWKRPWHAKDTVQGMEKAPVTVVTWEDAMAYCQWLSGVTGAKVSLPAEAQWEYACRAGAETGWFWGESFDATRAYAEQTLRPSEIGKYGANRWGLFDMHGNVQEWCLDAYGPYTAERQEDPYVAGGPTSKRVVRGGCAWQAARGRVEGTRSASRVAYDVNQADQFTGFRICLKPVE